MSNEGGGIQILGNAAPTSLVVENVVLQNNTAQGGAIATNGSVQLKVVNTLMADNRSRGGGGAILLRNGADATFTNITVTNNVTQFGSASFRGAILLERVTLNLVNSIVWNNILTDFATPFSPFILNVSFSNVGDALLPGPGNISADPRFINPGARNYRLQPSSPAIDAGTNTGAPATDLAGNSRPIDGDGDDIPIVDMGAFEFSFVN